ncbi:MAG: ABC transporter substrate-binding protein [Thermodesulfobacteriota bacterium]
MVSPLSAIAEIQGFDAREGLAVSHRQLKDGKLGMDAMLAGECDFSINAEPPIVQRGFTHDDFVILATLRTSDNASKIIARRDKGITRSSDLKGKKIGARKHVLSHFFLAMYLQKNGIAPDEVRIEFFEDSKKLPEAINQGIIDAYASANVHIMTGKQLLGKNALVLEEPGLCLNSAYLLARRVWVDANQEVVRRLLAALLAAEDFADKQPGEAQAMLAKHLTLPAPEVEAIFRSSRLTVSLPQPLLFSLEDQARWQIDTGQTTVRQPPNYMTFFRPEFLRSLRPAAVTMPQ